MSGRRGPGQTVFATSAFQSSKATVGGAVREISASRSASSALDAMASATGRVPTSQRSIIASLQSTYSRKAARSDGPAEDWA